MDTRRMINEVLAIPAAVGVETFDDPPDAALLPDEVPFVRRAAEQRRREFTTVRHCARQALSELGVAAGPLLPGERGAPRWPAGVVGSLTHCAGYRAAAVGLAADLVALGIDAEPHHKLPDGVLSLIARSTERDRIAELTNNRPDVCWDRLWFSAKESAYKVWSPLTGSWLNFDEATVDVAPDHGTFSVWLAQPLPVMGGPLSELDGRWICRDGLVLTAIVAARAGIS